MQTARKFTTLNRNEYAMSREDDFAQASSVRKFVQTGIATETELFRMGINADEPFRTLTFTDDPEELQALASQSTKEYVWLAYADGKIIVREPAGHGAWSKVSNALNGYVARARVLEGREPEAVSMDRVSVAHLKDLTLAPLSVPCGLPQLDATQDRLPRDIAWIEDADDMPDTLPYIESVTEAVAMGYRSKVNAHPACD